MRDSIRLGRIAGIEVGINWSWLIILVLILWTLAAGIFPAENPGLADGTYLAMAAVAALLFFASLFMHEMGHALIARREGMQIDGITLWLFGGVARFRGAFPTAGAEFRIAIAGPLVSVGLGGLFVAVAWATHPSRPVDGVASWLGYINIVLAVFNLLPAQPLDGGRVLHSALWKIRGDLAAATRIAAHAGEALGYLMILGGLAMFVTLGAFGGAWLAFLGWFLLNAARGEARAFLVREALTGLRVANLMTPDPVTVERDATLGEFMDGVAWRSRFTTYPVLDAGAVVGLLRFRDVVAVPRAEWDSHRVSEQMLGMDEVAVVGPWDAAPDALDALAGTAAGRALVIDEEGRLAGLLSVSDVMRVIEARGVAGPSRSRA